MVATNKIGLNKEEFGVEQDFADAKLYSTWIETYCNHGFLRFFPWINLVRWRNYIAKIWVISFNHPVDMVEKQPQCIEWVPSMKYEKPYCRYSTKVICIYTIHVVYPNIYIYIYLFFYMIWLDVYIYPKCIPLILGSVHIFPRLHRLQGSKFGPGDLHHIGGTFLMEMQEDPGKNHQ